MKRFRASELDVAGTCFGIRILPRNLEVHGIKITSPLIELYIEDDEIYSLQATFDALWLNDIMEVCKLASNLVTPNASKTD